MGRLPKGFLLGAATAAHQIEGNNVHSDFWAMEQMKHSDFQEPSLDVWIIIIILRRILV